jgi:hypothetical protein
MSNFTVTPGDDEGIAAGLNYLLSGPTGLGQNFAAFSSSQSSWLTGNFRIPYTATDIGFDPGIPVASLYVAPILVSEASQLDPITFQYTFATTQASPPFTPGQNIAGANFVNDYYNGAWTPVGVADCTTTYVVVRGTNPTTQPPEFTSVGTVSYANMNYRMSTDCNAKVTVTGPTDRVFITGQLNNVIHYQATMADVMTYTVQITRYRGFVNNDPVNPGYVFEQDYAAKDGGVVAIRDYTIPLAATSGAVLDEIDTIFASVVDSPGPGYYWYILEVTFAALDDNTNVTSSNVFFRSLSAQVVKQ